MPTNALANVKSLEAVIQTKYMPVLYDNIFVKSHPLTAILKKKAKTFDGREIGVPLEMSTAGSTATSNVYWGGQHGASDLAPATIDPFVLAKYTPAMLTGTLKFTHEEMLIMNSKEAIKNIVQAKVKNLQKTLEKEFASALWTNTSNAWTALPVLVNSSGTVGGIDPTTYTNWVSPVINADSLGGTGTGGILQESDLYDADAATYLPKLIARGIANAKAQTGESPDLVVVTQYLWDVLESILDPQKTGNRFSDRMGSYGFTGLNFRGIDVVADQDLPDTNSLADIYFLNTDYLYMFFNSGAQFTAGKFVESDTSNTYSVKVHTYGNLCISNRKAHCRITNVYSDASYS